MLKAKGKAVLVVLEDKTSKGIEAKNVFYTNDYIWNVNYCSILWGL